LRYDAVYHGPRELSNNVRRKLVVWTRRSVRRGRGPGPSQPDVSAILDLSRYAPDRYDLFRVVYAALLAHRPGTNQGPAVVFPARAQPIFRLWDEPALGWRELITPEPEVRVVPGNHTTITAEPFVGVLAKQLSACLDKADQGVCHGPPGSSG